MDYETRLNELLEYEEDWDGYGALSVKPTCVDRCRVFLKTWKGPSPDAIFATKAGGINLTWEKSDFYLDIDFEPEGTTEVFWETEDEVGGEIPEKIIHREKN